jgi:hypothetical protein
LNGDNNEGDNHEKSITIENLASGVIYYFRLVIGFKKVFSEPTPLESILVGTTLNDVHLINIDAIPPTPSAPTSLAVRDPCVIRIFLEQTHALNCSRIKSYQLYYSTNRSVNDATKHFISEIHLPESNSNLLENKDRLEYSFVDPPVCTPLYFSVCAVNGMGASLISPSSQKVVMGNYIVVSLLLFA